MTDELNTNSSTPTDDEQMMDFGDLLDSYDFDLPKRGDLLTGTILQVSKDEVIVDVGLKHDAIVQQNDVERLDDETMATLKPGSEVTVYIVSPQNRNGDLIVSIYRALSTKDWDRARELMESNDSVDATIVDTNRGGILVQFGLLRGFVPQSLTGEGNYPTTPKQKRSLIGKELKLKVIEVNQQRNRLVFSEKAAREESRKEQIDALIVGSVVPGRVVSLVDYGAFVDIGGIDGLIHISKLDWQHIKHPSEVLSVGDELEVQIDEVDVERERISLNRKILMPSPWESIADEYKVDDLVTGTVTNIAEFGVFVQLAPHIEGLVHLSEMANYGNDPSLLLSRGDEVPVKIISMDLKRQRIGLSLDKVTVEEQMDWMAKRSKDADETADDTDEPAEEVGEESAVAEVAETVEETVSEVAETVDEAVSDAAETVEEAAEDVVETAEELVSEAVETVEDVVEDVASAVEDSEDTVETEA